jgi:peptide deformylase
MILPIVAYGDPVLRAKAKDIDANYPELTTLIDNMWETMYAAQGVGLAAPQIGLPIRLFLVDAQPFAADPDLDPIEQKELRSFKKVFINPVITSRFGITESFNEGCLSIPNVREDVDRLFDITIEFLDENFEKQELELNGISARVVQHEYDHIEGILFTDKLSPLKKRLIKSRLVNISKGKVKVDYLMRFPSKKIQL